MTAESMRKVFRIVLPAIVVLSFLCVIFQEALPDANIGRDYAMAAMPIALFVSSILSIRVALNYERELKRAFMFMSLYFIGMGLANVGQFWELLTALLTGYMDKTEVVVLVQAITYAALLLACVYVLKVIDVQHLNRNEWVMIGLVFIGGVLMVMWKSSDMFEFMYVNQQLMLGTVTMLTVRFVDVVIITMLLPVLLLYRHQSELMARESTTFTLMIVGIILSLGITYIYEVMAGLLFGHSLTYISQHVFQHGSFLDGLYILSYLITAVGLYAHMNYDKWSLSQLEQSIEALDFEL